VPEPPQAGASARAAPAEGAAFGRILGWAGVLLLAFLLLSGFAAMAAKLDAVRAALAHVHARDIVTLLGLASAAYALRTLRWQLYARAQGVRVPLGDNALIYIGGFALGATPGRVGEVVRLWLLRRGYGYPYRRTAPLLVADRINDVNTLALLMLVGVSYVLQRPVVVVLALALVVALNVALRWPTPLLRGVDAAHRASGKRWPRLMAGLRRLLRRIAGTFATTTQLAASVLSLGAWAAECTSLFLILRLLGDDFDIRAAFAIHATASLIGALSMLPGGIGGFEATCAALLLWRGVPAADAVVATALLRVTTFWYSLVLGLPSLALALVRVRQRADSGAA
jgi:uncharacterized protein (TIRG00374 family)